MGSSSLVIYSKQDFDKPKYEATGKRKHLANSSFETSFHLEQEFRRSDTMLYYLQKPNENGNSSIHSHYHKKLLVEFL